MNKKHIKWGGIINLVLAIISGIISAYEKLIKEKELTKWLVALIILFLLAALICFFVLWKISEKEKKSLKNDLQKKEDRIRKLEKEMCKECMKIYSFYYPGDEWISFKESPNKGECFSLIEEVSDDYEEMSVHHLEKQWILISFWGEEEKDHLIDLIGKSIYLPVSKWEESKRDMLIHYKILCSNRKIHLDSSQLL